MALPNKELLPPGPWTVTGNTVKDANGRTVAAVFSRNPVATAYWIAETPKLTDFLDGETGNIGDSNSQIEGLRATVRQLRDQIAELEDVEERLHIAQVELEDLKNQRVTGK